MLLTKKKSVERKIVYRYGVSIGLILATLQVLVMEGFIPLEGWGYLLTLLIVIGFGLLLAANARKRINMRR